MRFSTRSVHGGTSCRDARRRHFSARWALVWTLAATARHDEALAEAAPALMMSGRHARILTEMAAIHASQGDRAAAEDIHQELQARSRTAYVGYAEQAAASTKPARSSRGPLKRASRISCSGSCLPGPPCGPTPRDCSFFTALVCADDPSPRPDLLGAEPSAHCHDPFDGAARPIHDPCVLEVARRARPRDLPRDGGLTQASFLRTLHTHETHKSCS